MAIGSLSHDIPIPTEPKGAPAHLVNTSNPSNVANSRAGGAFSPTGGSETLAGDPGHNSTPSREAASLCATRQAAIAALGQKALAGLPLSDLFQVAVSLVTETLNLPYSRIWRSRSDGHGLWPVTHLGWDAPVDSDVTVQTYIQVHSRRLAAPGIDPGMGWLPADGLSHISVTIPGQDHLLGILEACAIDDRPFTGDDSLFLQSIADILAIAIDRKRSEDLLHIHSQILEKVASGIALNEILHSLCLLLEQQSPGMVCSIILLDAFTQRLSCGAAPSLPSGFTQAVDRLAATEGGASFGAVACRKAAVFVTDTAQDSLWKDFQDLAFSCQIRACWSVPVVASTGDVLGIVSLSHASSCQPTRHHGQILETATHLARIAIERDSVAEHLKKQAQYDALTGLPNRILFMEELKQRLEYIRTLESTNYGFAVLFLDVDHFKLVNDSLGHTVGDQLLIAITKLLKRCIRTKDIFARLGGDEFAILIDTVEDISQAELIADRIRAVLSFPLKLDEHEVFASASIGIAHSSNGYEQPEDLLRDADTAMYRAKALGRSHYAVFDKDMHTHALSRLRLEIDLRHAVEDLFLTNSSQWQLYYQPIISFTTGQIVGFEALIRWFHPERGCISPAEFIPVAEETGLIVPIGRWVLHEACQQLRYWRETLGQTDLVVSVNVSSRQFMQPDFISQLQQIFWTTQTPMSHLKLEITESVLMEKAPCVTEQIAALKDLGVQLSLDDFGTGYSSLSYLYRFAINTLKIDRSFVERLTTGQDQIVQTIIALAHGLRMDVTAEGVETVEQLVHLQALGCEFGQGYFFSIPVARDVATSLLLQSKNWLEAA